LRKLPSWFGRGNTRAALLSSGLLALLITTSLASAAGEGQPIDGGARNPSANESQSYTRETEIIANTSTYGTRQSNKSTNGGAAIYGCRALVNNEACLRGSNLQNGLAFSFESRGPVAGQITAAGGDNARPFTTNATGVATGLNADRVDGQDASQIVASAVAASQTAPVPVSSQPELRTRWLLVNADGQIERQSGGFSVTAAYPANPSAANGNVYINAGEDLTNNGLTATIALQNGNNQGGGTGNGTNSDGPDEGTEPDASPSPGDNLEFSGEIAATQCALPGLVTCAPQGTNNNTHFVVSPRLSNGERTSDGTRKRFYVMITENAG